MTITTVTHFADAPDGFVIPRTEAPQYASPTDIPVEFFIAFDKSAFKPSDTGFNPYPTFNLGMASSLTLPVVYNGIAVDLEDTSGTYGSTPVAGTDGNAVAMLTFEESRYPATTLSIEFGGWQPGAAAAYPLAPAQCEVVFKHAATVGYEFTGWGSYDAPTMHTYMGFRPMSDWTGPSMVFIDNLGFAGRGYFDLASAYGSVATPVDAADRNLFAGFLKRGAMGKAVRDLVDDDVVMGLILIDTALRLVVNGTVKFTGTINAGGAPNISFWYEVTGPMDDAPAAAYDSIPFNITSIYAGTVDYPVTGYPTYNNTITHNTEILVSVDFAEAVSAFVSDMDLTARPPEAGWTDGYHSTGTRFDWAYGEEISETAMGLFYPAPAALPFWTNKIKTTEIVE